MARDTVAGLGGLAHVDARSLQRRCFGTILLLVAVGSCAGTGAPPSAQGAHVSIGAESVRVSVASGMVTVVSSAPGRSDVSTGFALGSRKPAVHYSSFGSSASGASEVILYGVSPEGAVSVATSPDGDNAVAADGTFVAVLQGDAATPPASIHWRFVNGSGSVLAEGDGPNT